MGEMLGLENLTTLALIYCLYSIFDLTLCPVTACSVELSSFWLLYLSQSINMSTENYTIISKRPALTTQLN